MSAQSILKKDKYNLQLKYNKLVVEGANKYLLKKRFDLGSYDFNVMEHNLKINSLLCSDTCENIENIKEYYIDENIPKDNHAECTCEDSQESCIPCKKTII
jgi:hypothetical protein